MAGVVALPFHLIVSLSGLTLLATLHFPAGFETRYGGPPSAPGAFLEPAVPALPIELLSLDTIADHAAKLWGGGQNRVKRIVITKKGERVIYNRFPAAQISAPRTEIYFTGVILKYCGVNS